MYGKPYQSKLLPYLEEIKKARKENISYRSIAELLNKKYGLEVNPSTIFSFVKTRSKKKREVYTIHYSYLEKSSNSQNDYNDLGFLKRKVTQPSQEDKPTRFHYNPDEPIT